MKSTIFAVCLFLFMTALTFGFSRYMNGKARAMLGKANEIIQYAENKKWDEAEKQIEQLYGDFKKIKTAFAFVENHEALELMEVSLKSALHYAKDKDSGQTNSQMEIFASVADRLLQHGIPSFKNIL